MDPTLFSNDLHIPEHEWIVADSEGFTTGSGHIPENNFPGNDIAKLLLVGFIGHLWIEICKNSRPLVILRMISIVDMKIFNNDPFRHITSVASNR